MCIKHFKSLVLQPIDSCLLMYSVQPSGRDSRDLNPFSASGSDLSLSLQLSLPLAILLPFICLKGNIWGKGREAAKAISMTRKLDVKNRLSLLLKIREAISGATTELQRFRAVTESNPDLRKE